MELKSIRCDENPVVFIPTVHFLSRIDCFWKNNPFFRRISFVSICGRHNYCRIWLFLQRIAQLTSENRI